MCSDWTHNGSGTGIVRCPRAKFSRHLPTARPLTICHIAYLNLLEREPSRLRRIGVDSPVKLAECRSLDFRAHAVHAPNVAWEGGSRDRVSNFKQSPIKYCDYCDN